MLFFEDKDGGGGGGREGCRDGGDDRRGESHPLLVRI